MTTTPDFQALKASLANKTFDNYIMPAKQKRHSVRESESSCPSEKDAYPTISDVMKAKNTFGNPVCYKSFYRCSICGQYHFTQKEEKPARSLRYDRKKENAGLKRIVSMYPSYRAEMEYISLL